MKNMTETHPWWETAVAYEIFPKSFQDSNGDGVGDLQGIIKRLPYLAELGIDLIWICPVYPSPGDDNGYDISNYQGIQREYGSMEDFDQLLEKAHCLGIRVIMDLVVNHTSFLHTWFIEARSSKDNPKRDWYIWRDSRDGKEPNNWESIFGGSAWEYDEKTKQYFLHTFGKTMPDINWENDDVKKAVYDMICWWLNKGIDGFRIDAVTHIHKPDLTDMPNPDGKRYVSSFDKHMNQPGILELLRDLKENTFSKYDIFTVAEANGVCMEEVEEWISRETGVFDSLFQFDHLNLWNLEAEDGKIPLIHLKSILSSWQYAADGKGSVALVMENHDLSRSLSRFGSPDRYFAESGKCLALMYFMQKGIPFIYQGQEIGMVDGDFKHLWDFQDGFAFTGYLTRIEEGMNREESFQILKDETRDNSRTPMQWDDTLYGGFSETEPWLKINPNYTWLNVQAQLQDEDSILNFYKKIIQIRKEIPALIFGTYSLLMKESESIYAYTREYEGEVCLIVCNLSEETSNLELPYPLSGFELVIGNYKETEMDSISLRAYECRLYKKRTERLQ
jgi:alpha-glucosidase